MLHKKPSYIKFSHDVNPSRWQWVDLISTYIQPLFCIDFILATTAKLMSIFIFIVTQYLCVQWICALIVGIYLSNSSAFLPQLLNFELLMGIFVIIFTRMWCSRHKHVYQNLIFSQAAKNKQAGYSTSCSVLASKQNWRFDDLLNTSCHILAWNLVHKNMRKWEIGKCLTENVKLLRATNEP